MENLFRIKNGRGLRNRSQKRDRKSGTPQSHILHNTYGFRFVYMYTYTNISVYIHGIQISKTSPPEDWGSDYRIKSLRFVSSRFSLRRTRSDSLSSDITYYNCWTVNLHTCVWYYIPAKRVLHSQYPVFRSTGQGSIRVVRSAEFSQFYWNFTFPAYVSCILCTNDWLYITEHLEKKKN